MSNPYLMRVPFCNSGANKNTIQVSRQPTQPPQDATYEEGFPTITMVPTGGIAPNGQDMNGILNEISSAIVHYCRGDRIQFDAAYAAAIGGYDKGAIVASNDYQKDYISLVDNNTADPNGSNTTWDVYAGLGSVPVATSTTTGTVKLVNSLSSTATDAALTAYMGRLLNEAVNGKLSTSNAFGVGQSWQNVTGSRSLNTTYTNTTTRPIVVCVVNMYGESADPLEVFINGSLLMSVDKGFGNITSDTTFIVPPNSTYRVTKAVFPNIQSWSELR